MCDTVSHRVNSFIHISLLASVHCKASLVLFEISGICYAVSSGPSLGLVLDILLLPCAVEILQQIIEGVDVGLGQLITLVLGLGSCRDGRPTSYPLSPSGGALQHCPG